MLAQISFNLFGWRVGCTSKERIVTMVDIRRPLSTLSMLARRSCMIFMVSPRWKRMSLRASMPRWPCMYSETVDSMAW